MIVLLFFPAYAGQGLKGKNATVGRNPLLAVESVFVSSDSQD